ncbi:MAG TPA: GntR family transcriptional regulator [Lactobacillus sp.]|uniref:GntR family transcriptional regulator n=1 Tax=Secundilactobacillus silagincola TaxID=1714681 RepID=A0A1Z5J552_9LACO|nr:GntR family transcriptional regulator [Secundilactobacillus silagincola]GAX09204.1 GntR family transcriptional regulator [Secundilactobacillus silagincola]HBF75495.1 GntR family transcriptional regulator [Lactobacillus sp.]
MQFDFNSTEPLYLQVAQQIEEAIFTNSFEEGTQVPSTTEVSKQFHINPATVLKGMNILVSDGFLEKRRGLGMFVATGAHAKIREKRQNEFYEDYVVNLVKEAKKLTLPETTILEMIKRGFKNG